MNIALSPENKKTGIMRLKCEKQNKTKKLVFFFLIISKFHHENSEYQNEIGIVQKIKLLKGNVNIVISTN